jgi:beta-glucosidase
MGFDGLVVSDWDGIDKVQSCSKDKCAQAVNAGIDLFMVPEQWRVFIENTVAQVRNGDIPEARIDDAVTRICGSSCAADCSRKAGHHRGPSPIGAT